MPTRTVTSMVTGNATTCGCSPAGANTPGWCQQYSDILPKWLELYIGLERAPQPSAPMRCQFVRGLMQPDDYARAVVLIANAHAPKEEFDRRVSIRMRRQLLLTQPGAPGLWAVRD
jgi:Domain of unknown function (DUF5753)